MKNTFIIIGAVLSFAAFVAAFWALVMTLWNAVVPNVFGLPELTFWQAGGLVVLIGLLSGAFRAAVK